ncbi:hypothetical protein DIURU_000063 [Diutina rugosa]|uniref:Matrin-type domain-containing protein n=1 Tax=Diutina rugosa TaxID=5481 RepID=A0A642UZZ0_DIURU|nr:uncharacterized protein DIURU_000063 [Diutina rugosa]KAA8908750.1 hypothetical protein DIURU_000063 [Diutina rugosa]
MAKYYCDYCRTYLTHDKPSVRKNHLTGRTHLKLYCQHYEQKAREQGLWNPNDMPYEITGAWLNRGAPGSSVPASSAMLPPPPTLPGLPNPPPAVIRDLEREQRAIHDARPKEFKW